LFFGGVVGTVLKLMSFAAIALYFVAVCAAGQDIWRLCRNIWRWRRDIRFVSTIGSPQGSDSLDRLQERLGRLSTDNGVQSLLQEARRREFQRVPEVADFLGFLSQCIEPRDGEAAPPTPAHDRADWTRWWDEYRARVEADAPLLRPSSETIDELGRTIEDVRRASAFRS
jgi:hypothetical protein